MLESPCLKGVCQLLFPEAKYEGAHPLIYKIGLGLKVMRNGFDALLQSVRQLAPVAPPTHGLIYLIQYPETSGQPRKVGLAIRRENGIRQRGAGGREREAG